MKSTFNRFIVVAAVMLAAATRLLAAENPNERLLMDFNWRFALGHATDVSKDFDHATGGFSYFAKTGFGSGASDPDFDDRGWRTLNLPHDWAVELSFSERGSASHGFKALGRSFPENSVGWYRKTFTVPQSDLGRRISVEFDGVFRDSIVWINGHFLGREESGYSGFSRNLTEFLNYGAENVLVVRVDASLEEGWFYEGAGIYRHVWLVKTAPLHVERLGTFVTSEIMKNSAAVTARATIINEGTNSAAFELEQTILNAEGRSLVNSLTRKLSLSAGERREFTNVLTVAKPNLWSLETPYQHKLVTTIRSEGKVVDQYETTFGIRTIRFDANEGFFLNGKHVKLKGTDNHQDHAGVGVALPDALQDFRISELKKFGCNAYRCSHNPPTPELLDACDRLGMLVIDENRLMGTTEYHYDHLKRMLLRDRNHPSVILWSVGNEEWRIEGNEPGTRITAAMQDFVKRIDPTRPVTVAISGGWGGGNSKSIEVPGLNYLGNLKKSGFTSDSYHAKRPDQAILATEECAFNQTRGIYFDDRGKCHLRAYDWDPSDWGSSAEEAWSHYADRPFLAGMFVWTGFDYRGEPTPFGWPAIASQFGILDTCGFPKDVSFYFKSWWSDEPVLHIFPHWNWAGKEGQEISVWAFSNCEEVELFLNGQSQGRKTMKKNSHLEWPVKYAPGTLLARGYKGGKEILTTKIETTGTPAAVQLTPNRSALKADGEDVAVITVQVNDAKGRMVPTADNTITFEISGPGKIIGVGNGDPSSHEPDQFIETVQPLQLTSWRMKGIDSATNRAEVAFDHDDSNWRRAFNRFGSDDNRERTTQQPAIAVYRSSFEYPETAKNALLTLALHKLGDDQSVYLNGQLLTQDELPAADVRAGKNVIAVIASRSANRSRNADRLRNNPGLVRVQTPAPQWKRSLFNGYAQVIVQTTGQPGEVTLTARSENLQSSPLKLRTETTTPRPAIP